MKFKVKKLKENHKLDEFKSYEKDLERFLIEDALDNQRENISLTFLFFKNQKLVSYISLLNDRIDLNKKLQKRFKKKNIHYKTLPALKIGRMCVHDRFLQQGLGKKMILFAIQKAYEISLQKAGCRFLIVDAKDNAMGFYKKLDFKFLDEKQSDLMFLDVKINIRHQI